MSAEDSDSEEDVEHRYRSVSVASGADGVFVVGQLLGDIESKRLLLTPKATESLLFQLLDIVGADELLPEWDVDIEEADDSDDWVRYHPRAATEQQAVQRALDDARGTFDDPVLHICDGPAPSRTGGMRSDELFRAVTDWKRDFEGEGDDGE